MKTLLIGIIQFIIFLMLLLWPLRPAIAQSELSDSQIKERLQLIQRMLDHGKTNANRWWTGWLVGYSAATVAQGAIALASDGKNTRQDMSLGAATTFLGAVGQIISPMIPGHASERLAGISETTEAERREKLIKAEELLKQSALRERSGRSWKTHAMTGAVNLGTGAIVWLGFKRSAWEGLANFALNSVITEAQIWTQPTRAIHDYDKYINDSKSIQKLGSRNPHWYWSVNLIPGGLSINIMF